jgi:outer membrane protein assembly factor BamD
MRSSYALLLAALLAGCGSHFKPQLYPDPQSLMAASIKAFEHGDASGARTGFTRITLELPQDDSLVIQAHLYIARCDEKEGEHLDAAREFRRVADDYPNSAEAPQALLEAGNAQARMWRAPDLDPTYGEDALSTFREVVQRFPGTPAADTAQSRIADLNNDFAKKELENGNFYFRLHAYDSAIIYFRGVVTDYPSSPLVPDALMRLVDTYHKIGYDLEARETCAHLRQYYPNTKDLRSTCPADTATS